MKVRQIEGESGSENEQENENFTLVVTNENGGSSSKIVVEIGGVSMKMLIDSGASCNIVDRETWEILEQEKIKCRSSTNAKKIYAYGSTTLLPVSRTFWTEVKSNDKSLENQEFIVIEGKGKSLVLGRDTALKLGILTFGSEVNSINSSLTDDLILKKYSKCFEGFGKLKDFQLKIPIDKDVEPVIQKVRRVPFHLREKLSNKLDESEKLDIFEKNKCWLVVLGFTAL